MKKGIFVSFEGGEGAGKTTQIKLLREHLLQLNYDIVSTREPGGTRGAEAIRAVILDQSDFKFSSLTETLMFFAARRDHIEKVVVPALERGDVVLCDRFTDSTFAYQNVLGNIKPGLIAELEKIVLNGLKPDITFMLDLDPAIGLSRAALRRGTDRVDRFEAEGLAFHQSIRQKFKEIAESEPDRCIFIQAGQPEDALAQQIIDILMQKLAQ